MKLKSTLLLLLLICLYASTFGQNITTIIGGLGDNGVATAARLANPSNVAVDKWGNIYIADQGNNLLRKVETSGIIKGYTGFGQINGLAADTAGNIYIADKVSRVVRKMNSSGTITIYAGNGSSGYGGDGGAATAAQTVPSAIAVDKAGNVYVSESTTTRIRKITPTGIISTIAGTGTSGFLGDGYPATTAKFNNITGLCADYAGNVYVADNGNNRVRKINTAGIVSTCAGNGIIGYAGDGGPATGANFNKVFNVGADTLGNIYISDNVNNSVRKVNTSGVVTTVAGMFISGGFSGDGGPATAAQLSNPAGAAVSYSGKIYIADYSNNRVREVNNTGIINTIAGCNFSGTTGYFGDGGPMISAMLNKPTGLTYDTAYNLYIADYENKVVRKVNHTTGIITTIAGSNTGGISGDSILATTMKLNNPNSVAIDPKGNIFICAVYDYCIWRVNTTGYVFRFAGNGIGYSGDGGPATTAKLGYGLGGIATDRHGNLYIADKDNNRIRKVDTNGIITTIAGTGTAGYFGDGGPATLARISSPYAIQMDTAGNLFIADYGNGRIRKIASSGIISTVAGGGAGGYGGAAVMAAIPQPSGIHLDNKGQIFIATNNYLLKVDTVGIIWKIAGNGSTGFTGDGGPATNAGLNLNAFTAFGNILPDENGNILVADSDHDRIRKIYNASISISTPNSFVCTSSNVTYTAIYSAAAIYTPHFHWLKNGINVGSDSIGYTTTGLVTGDKISCNVTDGFAGPVLAMSNQITMTAYSSSSIPTVGFHSYPYTVSTMCAGTLATCTPTAVSYGGSSPVYDWYVNGIHVYTGGSYVFAPANNDTVAIKMTSSVSCLTVDTAIFRDWYNHVTSPGLPWVTITTAGGVGTTVCTGTAVNCIITGTYLSSGSTFEWYKNDTLVHTGGNYNFIPLHGDYVYCKMTTLDTCVLTDTALSVPLVFTVVTPANPTINVISSPDTINCAGSSVTCSAFPLLGGTSPNYTWYKNDTLVKTGSSAAYTFTPKNGDVVYCKLKSNAMCIIADSAKSSAQTFTFSVPLPDSVFISLSPSDNVCPGTPLTFTATSVNGGISPIYDWYKNGNKVYTGSIYHYTPLPGGRIEPVYCRLTSDLCASPIPAISDTILLTVKASPIPHVSIKAEPGNNVCSGIPVIITATGSNEGSAPVYEWYQQGVYVFTGNPYTFTPNDTDNNIYCKLSSNAECVTDPIAQTKTIVIQIEPVPEITISCAPGNVNLSGNDVTLTASVSSFTSNIHLQWVKNNIPIPGATNYTYTSNNFSIWDSVYCTLTTSITCLDTAVSNTLTIQTYHGMRLYPNPNNGRFVINGNNYDADNDPVNIRIYNATGRLVYEKNATFDAITFYTEFDLSRQLPPGVYMLRLRYNHGSGVYRFVIK